MSGMSAGNWGILMTPSFRQIIKERFKKFKGVMRWSFPFISPRGIFDFINLFGVPIIIPFISVIDKMASMEVHTIVIIIHKIGGKIHVFKF